MFRAAQRCAAQSSYELRWPTCCASTLLLHRCPYFIPADQYPVGKERMEPLGMHVVWGGGGGGGARVLSGGSARVLLRSKQSLLLRC